MLYRKNLQVWGESIEEVSRYIKAKLQKDQEYFGYKLIRIESLKDHTYINYDIINSSQEKEEDDVDELYDFMIWGDYDAKIQTLASMTGENWNFHGKTNNLILKNYLKYTAKKLEEENKIITTDNYCLMNTGLFTSYYEPIYIYAEKILVQVIKSGFLNNLQQNMN